MSERTVFVLVHVGHPEAIAVAEEFARDMAEHKIQIRTIDDDAEVLINAGIVDLEGVAQAPGAAAGCELAVVFGGDGSILRAAELCRGTNTPILGVNLGHVGFLAEADVADLASVVKAVVNKEYVVQERRTIDVTVLAGSLPIAHDWALNEATIEKNQRMIDLLVEVDHRPLSTWGCDGAICATPTGSTAYNFSAGGPIVWPEVEALLVVPISAHALFARPIVVSPDSVIAFELVNGSEGVLWCDGRRTLDLPQGARVEIKTGTEPVRLATMHEAPFTDRLVRKFDLPVSGWRGTAT